MTKAATAPNATVRERIEAIRADAESRSHYDDKRYLPLTLLTQLCDALLQLPLGEENPEGETVKQLRVALGTEQTMHAAWRKRAEEAEAELHHQRAALDSFTAAMRDEVIPEIVQRQRENAQRAVESRKIVLHLHRPEKEIANLRDMLVAHHAPPKVWNCLMPVENLVAELRGQLEAAELVTAGSGASEAVVEQDAQPTATVPPTPQDDSEDLCRCGFPRREHAPGYSRSRCVGFLPYPPSPPKVDTAPNDPPTPPREVETATAIETAPRVERWAVVKNNDIAGMFSSHDTATAALIRERYLGGHIIRLVELRAGERVTSAETEGLGSPASRLWVLLDALGERFPGVVSPVAAAPPELALLAAIDAARGQPEAAEQQVTELREGSYRDQQVRCGLHDELAALKADFVAAAGEVLVRVPEPGTEMARLVSANVLMRRERDLAFVGREAAFEREQTAIAALAASQGWVEGGKGQQKPTPNGEEGEMVGDREASMRGLNALIEENLQLKLRVDALKVAGRALFESNDSFVVALQAEMAAQRAEMAQLQAELAALAASPWVEGVVAAANSHHAVRHIEMPDEDWLYYLPLNQRVLVRLNPETPPET